MDRLTLMQTFVCAVETGSFSAAAKRLGVGQPAVSKAVAQLEERLNTRLLLRSTRGLTPTDAGQAYYDAACRAIALADDADNAARGASAELSGRLRISAAVTFARLHIVPHLKSFLAAHPGLDVEVILDDRNIDLLENGIDVALRMGDLGDSSMTARRIARSGRGVFATPRYLAERTTPSTPADLANHTAVIYLKDIGSTGSWSFNRESTEVSVSIAGQLRVSAAEGVRAAVLADIGIAITSEWMFAPELDKGEVKAILTEWSLPSIDLWAVYPSGRMVSAKARAFVSFVQEIMGSDLIEHPDQGVS